MEEIKYYHCFNNKCKDYNCISCSCKAGTFANACMERIETQAEILESLQEDKIKPNYYHKGNVDVIEFCIQNKLDFLQGSVIKYVTRYKGKNGMEDLKKCKEFLDRIIKNEELKTNGR